MSNYSTPGVYIREEDKSLYTRGQSTSVAGFLGVASSGPVGVPVLITSLAAFEERFGGARLDSYLYHGVKNFFDQGGSVCYVVRTAHYTNPANPNTLTAQKPTANVPAEGSSTQNAATVSLPHGAFFNDYKVEFVKIADNVFDVILRDKEDNTLEYHRSVLFGTDNIGNDRHVEAYFPRASFRGMEVKDLDLSPTAGVYTLSGGSDGLAGLDDNDFIGSASAKTGLYAFDAVSSVRLLCAPGITSPAWIQALVAYCEKRQNVLAIYTTPRGLNPKQAINFRYGSGEFNHSAFETSYGAMYWPWVIQLDPATRQQRPTPPEGIAAGVMARTDFVAWPWVAPAGKNRGMVRNALGVEYSADDGENGELYDAQINVIRNFPESGVVVWGQKTSTSKPSAFDRLNVRRLFIYLGNALKETSNYLVFEPNNEDTWNKFINLARPILSDVQSKGGIYSEGGEPGFRVVCDETTNTPLYRERNTLRAFIYVRPTKASEFLELPFIASLSSPEAGFEFNNV